MKIPVICTTLLIEKSPQALPLGAACIATAIKNYPETKNLVDVKLKAFSLEDDFFKGVKGNNKNEIFAQYIADSLYKIAENVGAEKPFIFCFSVFVWNIKVLEKASEILRKKGGVCIAGGPEITAHPEFYKSFDYKVSGEGEITVPKLIKKIIRKVREGGGGVEAFEVSEGAGGNGGTEVSDGAGECDVFEWAGVDGEVSEVTKVSGAIKKSNDIIISPPADLNLLQSPYLDGIIDPAEYEGALWELARGCPFKCAYCYESKGEKVVRLFPMERIKAELELFAKKKIPQVFVLDPTYNVNKKRAVELLRLIASKTPHTFYYFEARAEFIDRELAREFTKIPCALQIGLQSLNEETLKLVNRPFDKKKFIRGISILNEECVTFGLDLIFGLPGESFGSFREGVDFAVSMLPNNLEIFCLSVLPGTDLYDRAESLGLVWEKDPPYHVIKTKLFTIDDMERARRLAAACSYFYNSGRAVTWFNSVCHVLKMKPSKFFELFYERRRDDCEQINCSDCSHIDIEKVQLEFLKEIFTERKLDRYFRVVEDIVKFYGAISRTTDTGKSENVTLNYNAEYVASEYASDIRWFYENVKLQRCKIQTFINRGQADFRFVKN